MKFNSKYPLLIALFLLSSSSLLDVKGSEGHVNVPGFRPQSKLANLFLEHLDSSRIAVLPTLIRTPKGTVYSEASQKAVVRFLKEKNLGIPEINESAVDVGKPKGRGQFEMFQNDLKKIGKVVKKQTGTEYFVVLEYLVYPIPSGDIAIGGIHIYVLNTEGENAFSFLLNSHHKIFAEAKLRSADSSNQGRDALVLKGTKSALLALEQQIMASQTKLQR